VIPESLTVRPALFRERLLGNRCAPCGSGVGTLYREMRLWTHQGRAVKVIVLHPCPFCGGHSRAFLDEASDA
jgi:hypothetical protein